MKNFFLLRVSTMSAIISLIALLVAAPISTVRAQRSLQQRTQLIEITRLDHAAFPDDPAATFEGARIVHNVTVNGQKGMRVHAKFRVTDGLDVHCRMIAYFFNDDGSPVEANDPKYKDAEGGVSAHADFTPQYDPAVYNDLQIFLPYEALNLEESGEYDLKFYLALYDQEGKRFFGKSGWYKFRMTMP